MKQLDEIPCGSVRITTEIIHDGNVTICLATHRDLRGIGIAKRHPKDASDPRIGDGLAISRALASLGHGADAAILKETNEAAS